MRAHDLVVFSSDAAFAVDAELRVVAWNERAHELLGYREEEVLGRPCWDVLQGLFPDGTPLCSPECQAKLCFGCCRPYGVRACLGRHRDGRWVELSLSSVVVPRGLEDGIQAVVFLRPLEEASIAAEAPSPSTSGQDRDKGRELLRVFTLGRFALVVGGRGVAWERWPRKQAVKLLKVLLTQRGRVVPREQLVEALWPGSPPDQGRTRLKVTVYALRRELTRLGLPSDLVQTVGEGYRLRREALWVDADVFEERVREGMALERKGLVAQALRSYREAEALYGGDFLAEERYEDWCSAERERLRELYLELMERLARRLAEQGDFAGAALACRKALVQEPCREALHRALMLYLWREGRRDEALAQYKKLEERLRRELGVAPLPETRALYERIRRNRPHLDPGST